MNHLETSLGNGGSIEGMLQALLPLEAGDIFTYDEMEWQISRTIITSSLGGLDERSYYCFSRTPNKHNTLETIDLHCSKSPGGQWGVTGISGKFSMNYALKS